MTNDLFDELDSLTQEDLNKAKAFRGKNVKPYDHFTAKTRREVFRKPGGKAEWIRLIWTNMNILEAETPTGITEDTHEFANVKIPDSEFMLFTEHLLAGGHSWKDLKDDAVVEYKLVCHKKKNADGTQKMRTYNDNNGVPHTVEDEQWYFQVVNVGVTQGSATNGSRPALSDDELDTAAALVIGETKDGAMTALANAGLDGPTYMGALLVGASRRVTQNKESGLYELVG